jgi:hypothetical protein
VGALAAQLLAEVESDREVLEALARRVAKGSSLLKDATGWLGAKISQLKLGRQTAGTLGTFQALGPWRWACSESWRCGARCWRSLRQMPD